LKEKGEEDRDGAGRGGKQRDEELRTHVRKEGQTDRPQDRDDAHI
jgi:hypothetical protein